MSKLENLNAQIDEHIAKQFENYYQEDRNQPRQDTVISTAQADPIERLTALIEILEESGL